jgi:uncharacterized sulfatase
MRAKSSVPPLLRSYFRSAFSFGFWVFCLACASWLACSEVGEERDEAIAATPPSAASARQRAPNIVLMIGDDHGYPYFGFMGDPIVKTPNLDRLAAGGTVFTHGFNTSNECRRSLVSLLTGLYPQQWSARNAALRRAGYPMGMLREIGHYQTLPRLLAGKGYQSFQGGKLWEGTFESAGFTHGMKSELGTSLEENAGGEGLALGRESMRPVLDFIAAHRAEPFFVWFAPMIPHYPHDPPQRFLDLYSDPALSASARAYYASISWYDALAGEVVEAIREAGLTGDTLIVYLADNGWFQQPAVERPKVDFLRYELLDKGKFSLFEQGFRTPIVFSWPGHVPEGVVRSDFVSTVDLFPTLLGWAGAEPPSNYPGVDLHPSILRGASVPRERIIGTVDMAPVHPDHRPPDYERPTGRLDGGAFLRDERWYYLAYEGFDIEALYDVRNDPDQEHDLVARHPGVARRMRREIERWLDETARPFRSVPAWEGAPRDPAPAR